MNKKYGVEKRKKRTWVNCYPVEPYGDMCKVEKTLYNDEEDCPDCENRTYKHYYPEFTKDKALDLLEFLLKIEGWAFSLLAHEEEFTKLLDKKPYFGEFKYDKINTYYFSGKTFAEAIADLMCKIHKHLTDDQRLQVKTILEKE